MSYPFPPDVQALIAEQMESGDYESEDDVLREALRSLAEEEENLQHVRKAIAELKAGDEGVPLDEAIGSIRSRYSPTAKK